MSIAHDNADSHYRGECRNCGHEYHERLSPNRNTNYHFIWIRCGECGLIGRAEKQS